ncbi:MAG: FliM/FliN family flagellar motor switch protein [Phycisphaerae bacterium]
MIVDQAEIDALLTKAGDPAALNAAAQPGKPPAGAGSALKVEPRPTTDASPEVARLLRIRVPVIVEMARRQLPVADVRVLSLGTIIEFSKHIESPLDLRIHNQRIGSGEAVKVGEKFGIRVAQILDQADRIRSMGES